jgi:hypothetical protein
MPSFQITINPNRRVAARFVGGVRRSLLKALEEENKKRGLKQADIARAIDVHRSIINRQLRGQKDMTLSRLAELSWAMGRVPTFTLPEAKNNDGSNLPPKNIDLSAGKQSYTATTDPVKIKNITVRVLDDAPV